MSSDEDELMVDLVEGKLTGDHVWNSYQVNAVCRNCGKRFEPDNVAQILQIDGTWKEVIKNSCPGAVRKKSS
jgi:hypothetical protein